jgi:hypothetical protein
MRMDIPRDRTLYSNNNKMNIMAVVYEHGSGWNWDVTSKMVPFGISGIELCDSTPRELVCYLIS